ncbi:Hsp90 cochaperone [Madurella fahalii]|uniref:Hsp90 cochaperone n=1 Tax=Madurella fahalii TaxID=1157608 RepID=A0ABQ0G2X8_9PEZI
MSGVSPPEPSRVPSDATISNSVDPNPDANLDANPHPKPDPAPTPIVTLNEAFAELLETIAADHTSNDTIIEILTKHGALISKRDPYEKTVLHYAAEYGRVELVKWLLAKDKSLVNAADARKYTPLHLACQSSHHRVVDALIEAKANVAAETSGKWGPIHFAAQNGNSEIVSSLLKADPELHNTAKDTEQWGPLHWAVRNGHDAVVQQFLQTIKDINAKTDDGWTVMHFLAAEGQVKFLKTLLDKKADVNAQDVDGWTPLSVAVRWATGDNIKTVKAFLDLNDKSKELLGRPRVAQDAKFKETPLLDPNVPREASKIIPDHSTVKLDLGDKDGLTPLHLAALEGKTAVLKELIGARANILCKDNQGNTALHLAASGSMVEAIGILLGGGAKLDAKNTEDRTPLHAACLGGNPDAVKELIDWHSKLGIKSDMYAKDSRGRLPIHFAAEGGNWDLISSVLEPMGLSSEARDKDDMTLLHIAAEHGRYDVVKNLLKHRDAVVDAWTLEDRTPLHLAAANGKTEVAQLLLDYGADCDAIDVYNNTPLHFAAEGGHLGVVSMLFAEDADPIVVSHDGETPQSVALREGHDDVVAFFDNPKFEPKSQQGRDEVITRAKSKPTDPEGKFERTCTNFKSLLWIPSENKRYKRVSVWDMVYGDGLAGTKNQRRWVHLPANNVEWVEDLIQRIFAVDQRPIRQFRKTTKFIQKSFYQLGRDFPFRRPHFRRERPPDDPFEPGEMLSIVMPIIDVDLSNPAKAEMKKAGQRGSEEDTKDKKEPDQQLVRALNHFQDMEMLQELYSPSSWLHASRSLDQTYIESLTDKDLEQQNDDQVLFKYLKTTLARKEKEKANAVAPQYSAEISKPAEEVVGTKQKGESKSVEAKIHQGNLKLPLQLLKTSSNSSMTFGHRVAFSGEKPAAADPIIDRPKGEAKPHRMPPVHRTTSTPSIASSKRPRTGYDPMSSARTRILMVPQLWIWKIDEKNIITTFPERWDKDNQQTLVHSILSTMIHDGTLKFAETPVFSPNQNNFEQNSPEISAALSTVGDLPPQLDLDAQPGNDKIKSLQKSPGSYPASVDVNSPATDTIIEPGAMIKIIGNIFHACIHFPESTFQFFEPMTYGDAFANSIADISNDITTRYKNLEHSINKMNENFVEHVKQEMNQLIEINDIIGELGMITRVFQDQERIVIDFLAAKRSGKVAPKSNSSFETAFSHPALQYFKRLQEDATRVQQGITTLLDLRQRETNLEEAISTTEQSSLLFVFTIATVVFTPMSWVVALLAVKIDGLPEDISPSTVALACVSCLLITLAPIAAYFLWLWVKKKSIQSWSEFLREVQKSLFHPSKKKPPVNTNYTSPPRPVVAPFKTSNSHDDGKEDDKNNPDEAHKHHVFHVLRRLTTSREDLTAAALQEQGKMKTGGAITPQASAAPGHTPRGVTALLRPRKPRALTDEEKGHNGLFSLRKKKP